MMGGAGTLVSKHGHTIGNTMGGMAGGVASGVIGQIGEAVRGKGFVEYPIDSKSPDSIRAVQIAEPYNFPRSTKPKVSSEGEFCCPQNQRRLLFYRAKIAGISLDLPNPYSIHHASNFGSLP